MLTDLADGDPHYARELIKELADYGLAATSYDGQLDLTGRGRHIAAKIVALFDRGWRRDDQTRRWVLETARDSRGRFGVEDLMEKWGTEQGRSTEEIARAIKVLSDHGMVKTLGTNGTPIVMGIEQDGRDALEREIAVWATSAPAMVVNNDHSDHSRTLNQHGGTIGGVQMGDQSTQRNTVALDADPGEVRATLRRALEHVDGLPSQIASTVRDALNEAIAETKAPEPRVGFIRDLAQKVILAVGVAAGSAAGGAIFALVGPLAS